MEPRVQRGARVGAGRWALAGVGALGLGLGGAAVAGKPAAGARVVGSSGYALRPVPAGSHKIGCTPAQGIECYDDEKPARKLTLSRGLWVGETEVTQALYQQLMGSNPAKAADCGPGCPVERVSWFDAVAFANALSAAEGLEPCYVISGESVTWPKGPACAGFRLPTELEWEVAARGGADTKRAGSDALDPVAVHEGNSEGRSHPVGQKAANGYGLHDMSGNVWEWVWDGYGPLPDSGADPIGPDAAADRVLRGGSFLDGPQIVRVSYRSYDKPVTRDDHVGLRLVRTAL
jgi:formylglycine-generating enzyme required for sulfatase activity